MEFLDKIKSPSDIKKLNVDELKILAKELRQVILDTVLSNGGHLASSLGVVEIIIAMHYVFDAPEDKLIFDVGHQCYAHKLLTGRYKDFGTLRKMGGLSGFPKRKESEFDTLDTGHSATSLSAACGITRALKLNEDSHVAVSLIGDGALTGGMAYEALNDADEIGKKQIIILNDNSMSITENVGSTSRYLLKLHGNHVYRRAKSLALRLVGNNPEEKSSMLWKLMYSAKQSLKYFIQGGMPFEQFGARYFGPIDGHNIEQLIYTLQLAKDENCTEPILIHAITIKGKGYREAEANPQKYHGYGKGGSGTSMSAVFGETLEELAHIDDRIYAVTAAMTDGVGLIDYQKNFPNRFADVGIAEQHAMTMSAGLALTGYKPYFAVYSSFLQRAYDQLVHDICLQDLPVTICIDRAGIVPSDGETHQGIYDLAILRVIPNMTIANAANSEDLKGLLKWSREYPHPLAIRYAKGAYECDYLPKDTIELGKWSMLNDCDGDIIILATGAPMVKNALKVAEKFKADNGTSIGVVNARFVKPLDIEMLKALDGKTLITLEDNLLAGGFGSAVIECVNAHGINAKIHCLGIDNNELQHASIDELQRLSGIDVDSIVKMLNTILLKG